MGISSSILKLGSRVSKKEKEKERLMLRNGGMLLEELLHSCDGKYNPFRIFSAKEIANATNNYDEQFQDDYWFKMYKGSLNGRQICVKSFNSEHGMGAIGFAINEIVFASQLNNHNHILMLLGCCLETEAPLLVYEYAENGALSDHIFNSLSNNHQQQQQLLPWDCRLKIAKEIADALAYLHTGLSMPIVHRNIKPSNIYLDGNNYFAKLSDFGSSLSIPLGDEYVEDIVTGTIGYLDPEYWYTNQVSEKCDVYSFGSLLIGILSGERILSLCNGGNDRYKSILASCSDFVASTSSGRGQSNADGKLRLHQFVNETAKKYMGAADIMMLEDQWKLSMAWRLASKCINLTGEERPTMTQVAQEITRIIKFQCNTSPSIPIIMVTNEDMSDSAKEISFFKDVIGLTISTLH